MPESADEHFARGDAFLAEGRYQEAVDAHDLALGLQPGLRSALNNRGAALRKLGRDAEALASFDLALQLESDDPGILRNRASTLRALYRLEEALAGYEAVLSLRADDVPALIARGMVLLELQRPADAILSLDRATVVRPDHAPAHYQMGVALRCLGNHGPALERFERAHALDPALDFLLGDLILARRQVCDWHDAAGEMRELSAAIARGASASTPFLVLAVLDSPALQRQAAESYARTWHPSREVSPAAVAPRHSRRLRLGYFSADFRNHAVAYQTAELFQLHDRGAFEVIAFSLVPPAADAMEARLREVFDRFIDVSGMTDAEVARLAREIGIDIVIDLGGYTEYARTGIFAHRAAPIQASYLGYLGTMGAAYYDYLFADRVIVPRPDYTHYSERIVRLPSYQVNDSRRRISDACPSRRDEALPERAFVFCCFNSSYKIAPDVFDCWMRILSACQGSVLWLFSGDALVSANLGREAAARGIDPGRLVFASRRDHADHLARYRLADLFLDTLPCNAGATASDALWAGVPVLTRCGEAFAARVAASLLHAAGLPELVTHSSDQYVELAIALAGDADRMASLCARLAANRETCLLFDSRRFTKSLESAFLTMQQRHEAGLVPENFDV